MFALLGLFFLSGPAVSQELVRIAAVVNDNVISMLDVYHLLTFHLFIYRSVYETGHCMYGRFVFQTSQYLNILHVII